MFYDILALKPRMAKPLMRAAPTNTCKNVYQPANILWPKTTL